MCLIRCALATNRKLIAPYASPWFSEEQLKEKDEVLRKRSTIPQIVGHGFEPAYRAVSLPKKAAITLSCRY